MAKAAVYCNKRLAGYIEKKSPNEYEFSYTPEYFNDSSAPGISLTLTKSQQVYKSETLFPFFTGLLAEGINKDIQCRLLRIDETDDFTRLIRTAGEDTIGAITVKEITG